MHERRSSLAIAERLRRATVVEVVYPAAAGRIGLRGSEAPLSWEATLPPTASHGDRHVFELDIPDGAIVDLKLVRDDDDWAAGRNYVLHAGDHLHLEPSFDRTKSKLLDEETLDGLRVRVLLPPTYDEQSENRYPVLYALDGQALWTTSQDPYGVWSLDATLDRLFELGAVEELIVVGIDTSEDRIARLSPVPDEKHGGGRGQELLDTLVSRLKPQIDARFRTRAGRDDTAIIGSSMGGLFSFFAAWSRPDVFGKAACLSSSFWWAQRHIVRVAQEGPAPSPRPMLYLDSGAALHAMDGDPSARDGFHDTRSMHRALSRLGFAPGVDLHRLTFPGQTHDAGSWSQRVAIPLQLLFAPPPAAQVPAAAISDSPVEAAE